MNHRDKKIKVGLCLVLIILMAFIIVSPQVWGKSNENNEKGIKSNNSLQNNHIFLYDPFECNNNGLDINIIGEVAKISGTTAEEKIWSGLKSLGLTDEIVAGAMGNMMHEGSMNPARYEDSFRDSWNGPYDWENDSSESRGVGLVQWSFGRRVGLFNYMKKHNKKLMEKYLKHPEKYGGLSGDSFIKNADSEEEANAMYSLELTFLMDEIKNTYSGILEKTSVEDAAGYWSVVVEACEECRKVGSPTYNLRVDDAKKIFEKYSGKSVFNVGVSKNSNTMDGSNVTWIGDSISEMSKDIIKDESKLPNVDLYAEVGKHWAMNSSGQGGDGGLKILEDLAKEGKVRDVLVFALGTNDEDGISEDNVKKIIELAPDVKTVILMTNYNAKKENEYEKNNKVIKAAIKIDSRFKVADWAKVAAKDSGKYLASSDGIHPTKDGQELFVKTIVDLIGTSDSYSESDEDPCDCGEKDNNNKGGVFAGRKYNDLSEGQLKALLAACKNEQSGVAGIKFEASIMANLYEKNSGDSDPNAEGLINYVKNGKWFASSTREATKNENYSDYTDKEMKAIKDVLVNGNRVVPAQILEHDCIGDIEWLELDGKRYNATNAGGCKGSGLKNEELYISGKTKIHNVYGSTYIFYRFPVEGDMSSGDPFGYFEDNPPSDTTTSTAKTTTSSITWDKEGWIKGGIDGYTKESAIAGKGNKLDGSANKDFETDMPNGKGKGPNKITLHSTEGGNGGGKTAFNIFKNTGYFPHFTIDLKEKHVFQHLPIYKTSGAVAKHDASAGIQIEIIGYSDANLAKEEKNEKWIVANFSDDELGYLVKLLKGISKATGIPLKSTLDWKSGGSSPNNRLSAEEFKNYNGILGHRHVPDNDHWDPYGIWENLSKLFDGVEEDDVCGDGDSSGGSKKENALQELVKEWAWPKHGNHKNEPRDAYKDIMAKYKKKGWHTGNNNGQDCGAFVGALIKESGWDPDYKLGSSSEQAKNLKESSTWSDVTDSIKSDNDAKPGDVIICNDGVEGYNCTCGKDVHHVLVFVGDVGFTTESGKTTKMASASQNERWPEADWAESIMKWKNCGFHIFRKK